MKVLHVDSGTAMRGGQWQALYLMVGQKTIHVEPLLLAKPNSPLFSEAVKRGVACEPLSWIALRRHSATCDLTHVHDARSHTMAAVVARTPIVVSRRVAFPVKRGFLSQWKYARAARFLAVSRFVAQELERAAVPAGRIAVVYDGVPIEPLDRPQGTKLLIPYWQDARKLSSLAREAAERAGVEWIESKDLAADLPNARALLYLTEMEGLGSGALLALSQGVPVIGSRIGGLPEIVRNEASGLLVDNELTQVTAAIQRLMRDAPFAAMLGKQGRDMVRGGFTLADMVLRTHHEYKKVLA